ncbi:hypothetical protein M409DRAFT_23191 [Zasmidium cellare ATCC 36951]|uniref:Transcription factor domain-containing protein n=1 Tax=Zasmidium cellare ATCC 36951 TaxID=1080233 RepID=A0A6A6CM86_ZASCE|nr:uncharacterized protein M409DRAFT_23191 [Zasmidium cellare ATCC 36951]KAF2166556.1 hypothetical protein M409DRAFT_23191 [Zasmidium cellare ATCC 36951]
MYLVWPVVDVVPLMALLREAPFDNDAYILGSSVCIATVLQLQLEVGDTGMPSPQACIDEIEDLRNTTQYRRRPTLDSLLASFFMHISYLHVAQQTVSTLLLRESIAISHLLSLHQPSHYEDLDQATKQAHLRIVWLLFITERAHARQYDMPCTATISPELPPLQQEDVAADPSAFICLCNMFACFDSADVSRSLTADNMLAADSQLITLPTSPQHCNSIQQADLLVTRQWMRLLLWKTAIVRLTMTAEPSGNLDSLVLPIQIGRDLLSSLTLLSMDALEAHGPGMELKLFTVATSLADVMTCMPTHNTVVSEFGAGDCLLRISELLQKFRGGTEAVMSVLRERFVEIGLDQVPIRCITEVSPASDESEYSETSPDTAITVGNDSPWQGWT